MVIALDKKVIDSPTSSNRVPALAPQWKQDVTVLAYLAPPLNTADAASVEEWSEQLSFMEEDLHWLLSLPHDKFWCQVIFEESVLQCIDSFLRYAPRSYDIVANLPPAVRNKNRTIQRLVFLVCVRLATHKESKDCFITPSVFGDIIYENFIFDVPKLMDLCVLYGASNGPLLTKMIENIFKNQPRYNEDLQAVVPTILQVFNSIQKKCADDTSTGSPQRLSETRRKKVLEEMPVGEFQDIIFYLLDTSITLRQFLLIYVPACRVFSNSNFHVKLAQFYESIVTCLCDALRQREWDNPGMETLLRGKLHSAQVNLLHTFHQIVDVTCIQPLLEMSDPSHAEKHIEEYLNILTSCIGEKRFLGHLDSLHPFQEDWDMIQQTQYAVDETQLQFLQEGVRDAAMAHGKMAKKKQAKKEQFSALGPQEAACAAAAILEDYQNGEELEMAGACAAAPAVSDVELASLTSNVKDLLPDLGDGFVEVCLSEFNYDVEKLINALLEDNLPPHLQELDRTMPRSKQTSKNFVDPMDAAKEESVLSRRKNVFDNDEFDVFNRKDVDVSRIHVGKKDNLPPNKKAVKSFLDDKSDVQAVRGRYDPYGVSIDIIEEDGMNNEYDDEYDDTYDDNEIGADDADSADELTTRRPFTVPRVLGGGSSRPNKQDSLSEESEDDSPPRDQFVEDPAAIRERQAQRYASRQQHQNRRPPAQQPQKNRDVKGAAKGQGQSTEVLRNRANKEKNKASRVHHNRKALSDKKRRVP